MISAPPLRNCRMDHIPIWQNISFYKLRLARSAAVRTALKERIHRVYERVCPYFGNIILYKLKRHTYLPCNFYIIVADTKRDLPSLSGFHTHSCLCPLAKFTACPPGACAGFYFPLCTHETSPTARSLLYFFSPPEPRRQKTHISVSAFSLYRLCLFLPVLFRQLEVSSLT